MNFKSKIFYLALLVAGLLAPAVRTFSIVLHYRRSVRKTFIKLLLI